MRKSFTIPTSATLEQAIAAIADNGNGCVLVVNSKGQCVGSLSDGDIRKAFVKLSNFSTHSLKTIDLMNKSFYFVGHGKKITSEQLEKFKLIPVLNDRNEIVKIRSKKSFLEIGGSLISSDAETYVIAEIGNNHQGNVSNAKELIVQAIKSGASAVKFQHRNLSETYRESSEEDLGVEYVKNLLSKYSLSWTELCEVMSFAKDLKIDVLCTPFDIRSAAELISFGVDGIKIASADLTNHELMRYCGQSGIPMIVSTGMSTELEIIEGADLLTTLKSDYAFLHCNSTYPAPYDDINLKFINRLRALGLSEIVGWSGHERGFHVCIAAVAMGAKIIEKHFTLDKTFEGNDHKVSLLPGEFKLMVDQIREVESAFGSDGRIVSQGEMINRENLSKSIVAKFDISKDEVLTRDMIEFRSPGRGIQPNRVNEFLGRKVVHPVKANDFIYPSTFEENTDGCELKELPGVYYGIPVRYHDIHHSEGFGNMVEFHLTYDDLSRSESLNNMIIPENVTYFTVHAPEMFADDRLLNLAACDEKEFIRSIENMKTVIEIADKIRVKVGQHKVYVVTNVGGFTNTGFEHDTIKLSEMYQRVSEAIDILRHPNVELIIQTMPPFPWHFGGQAYHNLFVNPREIIDFCSKHSTKICLDLSHTFLACKFLGTDFYLAIEELMPFTQHLHVSDAEGLSGEGLQIGNGSINWERIASIVSECKNDSLSVIPEVWQGHKDQSFHAKKGLSIFLSFF